MRCSVLIREGISFSNQFMGRPPPHRAANDNEKALRVQLGTAPSWRIRRRRTAWRASPERPAFGARSPRRAVRPRRCAAGAWDAEPPAGGRRTSPRSGRSLRSVSFGPRRGIAHRAGEAPCCASFPRNAPIAGHRLPRSRPCAGRQPGLNREPPAVAGCDGARPLAHGPALGAVQSGGGRS